MKLLLLGTRTLFFPVGAHSHRLSVIQVACRREMGATDVPGQDVVQDACALDDARFRKSMKASGWTFANREFPASQIAARMFEVYERMLR